ncbi:MAG: aspartate aminotransferase family protein [Bacteroidales bacterium]|nr:aspartate aminotransferase family protein [Bacteroidales bacterium]
MLTNRQLFRLHMGLPSVEDEPVEIVRAEGIYLYNDHGQAFIDLVSGVSVSNTGHLHPRVVDAIKAQLDQYMHVMVYGKFLQSPQVQLAGKLAEMLPASLDAVYFVSSGSEAIEGAIKLAKRLTGRTGMVTFKNAYHGGTAGALSLLGNESLKNAFRPLLPGVVQLDFNDFHQIELISKDIACVVIEPIQAEAGIILPLPSYLEAIRKRCDETGSLLVFDEIQMGFGRTGKMFAFEHSGVVPDILCLAKAMGGGLPLGAFISSHRNMHALTHDPELGHITTFGGHPVSCAASLASIDVLISEQLIESADYKGSLFSQRLINHPAIREVRQAGLMLGVELNENYPIEKVMKSFKKHRLIVDQFLFNESSFRIAPPLTITETEIQAVVDMIIESIDAVINPKEP